MRVRNGENIWSRKLKLKEAIEEVNKDTKTINFHISIDSPGKKFYNDKIQNIVDSLSRKYTEFNINLLVQNFKIKRFRKISPEKILWRELCFWKVTQQNILFFFI